ncbi:glycosyltransferase family 61 protein [Cyanobium gracile]|uniref:glycosyltransferase family 61 protein n=1 Tax=Cyanobium gracile TaxID=59930 RepID=UPI002B1FA63F|nr:glycosyltransferase family 61 protein [Cyanobium gracile]
MVLRSFLPRCARIDAPVCSLVDIRRWSGAYFHWFLDALPRLIAADDHRVRSGERTLVIVPSSLQSWQEESLDLLGVKAEHRLPHHPPRGGGLEVRCLIAGVAQRWQRQGLAPFDAISPWSIRQLAQRFSTAVSIQDGDLTPQRIFLSRRGAPNRNVINEDAVLALLKPHGFVSLRCERLTLRQQISIFRSATHIVAPHGGALTNLIHARGGHLLELFQAHHGVRPEFFQLAAINGLSYRFLLCSNSPGSHDFHVDIDRLREWLAMTL